MAKIAEPQEGLASIGRDVAQDAVRLVRAEIDLARSQLMDAAKRLALAAAFGAVAVTLLLIGVIEALSAIPAQFGPQLFGNAWAGWLVFGGLLALLAGLFGVLALGRIRRSVTEGKQTVEALKEDSEWLKRLSKRKNNGS